MELGPPKDDEARTSEEARPVDPGDGEDAAPPSVPADAPLDVGISLSGAKTVYRHLVEHFKKTGEHLDVKGDVDELDLRLSDEWTHVGFIVLACLDNMKLLDQFKKGNVKALDALMGKTLKMAAGKLDAALVKELLPLIIERHWP